MLFALLALAATGTQAYPDPLTPAASGQVQCYAPTDRKTCTSIGTYTANGDGTFANGASILLNKQPVVIMQSTTPVTIKAGAVCGTITRDNIAKAGLTVNGQALPPEKAGPVLEQIAGALGSVIDHEICTTYVPDGAGFTAKSVMDGKAQPNQDQKVIWVSPSDGYTVAP